ncbi:MAG: hypothetical protein GXX92_09365 [Clostridiales bacterium]|nr:hypothetical protein [Clostridiales bacterium]
MDRFTVKQMEEALIAIASMMDRTEKAKEKFKQGTSQYTLQRNRLKALQICSALISNELANSETADSFAEEDLKNALAPIISLMSKSEKALGKLARGTWQHTMLSNNQKALNIALPLLMKALNGADAKYSSNEIL